MTIQHDLEKKIKALPDTNKNVIENAVAFLEMLPFEHQKALNIYEIRPTSYGTIVLEWTGGKDSFVSIEIGKSQIGYFSETPDGENPFIRNIEFLKNEIPSSILNTLNKIFSTQKQH